MLGRKKEKVDFGWKKELRPPTVHSERRRQRSRDLRVYGVLPLENTSRYTTESADEWRNTRTARTRRRLIDPAERVITIMIIITVKRHAISGRRYCTAIITYSVCNVITRVGTRVYAYYALVWHGVSVGLRRRRRGRPLPEPSPCSDRTDTIILRPIVLLTFRYSVFIRARILMSEKLLKKCSDNVPMYLLTAIMPLKNYPTRLLFYIFISTRKSDVIHVLIFDYLESLF